MRLSPKSIFFGLVAFGLPVAVGWTLAGPPKRPSVTSLPTGTGGIGAAPGRTDPDEAVTDVRYQPRQNRNASPSAVASGAPLPSLPAASTAPAVTPSAEPAPTGSAVVDPLPELTAPPVPTPTEVTSEPSPPAPPPAEPSGTGEPSAQP